MSLSQIWTNCITNYPNADHEQILYYIEKLQSLLFKLD